MFHLSDSIEELLADCRAVDDAGPDSFEGLFMPANVESVPVWSHAEESSVGNMFSPAGDDLDEQLNILLNETVQLPSFIDSSKIIPDVPPAQQELIAADHAYSSRLGSTFKETKFESYELDKTAKRPIPLPFITVDNDLIRDSLDQEPFSPNKCEFENSLQRIFSENVLSNAYAKLELEEHDKCDFHKSKCEDSSQSSLPDHKYLGFERSLNRETGAQTPIKHYLRASKEEANPKVTTEISALNVKTQNYITSLESRIQVLESRLEHSTLVSEIHEKEKHGYIGKIEQLAELLRTEKEKYHDLYLMFHKQPKQDFDMRKTPELEVDFKRKKADLKREIKEKMLTSSFSTLLDNNQHDERSRQKTRDTHVKQKNSESNSPEVDTDFDENTKFPFIIGTATNSFSLPANIQKVRHLLRTSVVRPRSKSRERRGLSKNRAGKSGFENENSVSYSQIRDAVNRLELEYDSLNREYDQVLQRYKIKSREEDQNERTNLADRLRIIIKEMDAKMEDISRLQEFSKVKPQVDMSQSPSKALSKLCALRGAQKLQESIMKTENILYSKAFGGSI